ncbi:MAG: hypothetical protein OHK93_002255 [Ramalina farinacea]|uniref:WD40 repeat-like protein n=1 Tax=Ramalina farinacea TaxID=258253 RepID=A0AA43QR40_9LECA|nr:hypothetical protein [Ramalina farinacea]
MPLDLFARAIGALGPFAFQQAETARLLDSLQAAPNVKHDGSSGPMPAGNVGGEEQAPNSERDHGPWAHRAGVNCLTIDRFEGRYMLSGGADASIILWDLEAAAKTTNRYTNKPLAKSPRSSSGHKFGITHLSFYPFDSLAFLASSYDHKLGVYATETLSTSASFDLGSVIYSHDVSNVADHLLVACATQHPAVRLVDLRSGASAHSLAGHQGAVLSVAWSPKDEHILASGGIDGTARVWDIRRSAGSLGLLDLEDSLGVGGEDGFGTNAMPRSRGKAHVGPCNGVVWRDDGRFVVTAGHDERVRVWDVSSGANTLSHFGPIIKNTILSTLLPPIIPSTVGSPRETFMIYPNEKEILMFDLHEGSLLKRLRVPGANVAQAYAGTGSRNVKTRVTSIAWKAHDLEMYSAHSDGFIRTWKPTTKIDTDLDREEAEGVVDIEDNERKRKREALDEMFRDLTRQKITFT